MYGLHNSDLNKVHMSKIISKYISPYFFNTYIPTHFTEYSKMHKSYLFLVIEYLQTKELV